MSRRFSVEKSMGGAPSAMPQQQSQPYSQPYSQPNYGTPYSAPSQQQQMSPANWPNYFPKEMVAIDRGVFMDDTQPILSPGDIRIIPNSLEAIRMIRLKGYKLMIFFNEPLISQGKMTAQSVDNINMQLMNVFGQAGIFSIDGMLYSTTNMKEDIFAMPNTGMMKRAENEMKVNFKGAYFAGDKIYNLKAADSFGIKPILIQTGNFSDTQNKLNTFANKDLKTKIKTFNSLFEFAESLS